MFVRNSGQVKASMIGCQMHCGRTIIWNWNNPIAQPGQMGSVICDMQAPDNDDSLLIEAEVDRGTSIDEVNEETM